MKLSIAQQQQIALEAASKPEQSNRTANGVLTAVAVMLVVGLLFVSKFVYDKVQYESKKPVVEVHLKEYLDAQEVARAKSKLAVEENLRDKIANCKQAKECDALSKKLEDEEAAKAKNIIVTEVRK